jgi:hypothetical protein
VTSTWRTLRLRDPPVLCVLQASGGQLRDDATALCLDWHGGPPRDRDATSEQAAKGDSNNQRRPEREEAANACTYLGWRRRPWISAWLSIFSSSSSRATTTTLFQTPGWTTRSL